MTIKTSEFAYVPMVGDGDPLSGFARSYDIAVAGYDVAFLIKIQGISAGSDSFTLDAFGVINPAVPARRLANIA